MTCRSLTQQERGAIALFAKHHGRRWKEALRLCWINAAYRTAPIAEDAATLQSLRNSHGPAWLINYRADPC